MENIKENENKLSKLINDHYVILYILLLLLLIFNIFYKINTLNINFDEARHGISAYEMLNKGHYIVNTFEYKNDYWNLKPILSFLPVMLGYKLAGFNMVGLRLLSCLSTIFTIILVTVFVKFKHGKLASIISFAVLASNVQYIIYHCSRSAEADAVYILFFTFSVICMQFSEKKPYCLYLSFFFCSLAFLTKSFHVISLLVILAVYILLSGNFKKYKLSQWLLLFLSFIIPVLLWGILRYHHDGMHFFEKMITYDLLDRSSNSIEGHKGGIFFYIITLLRYHGAWFVFLIPCSIYYVSQKLDTLKNNKYAILIALWIAVPLILYSIAKTKIEWYILPVYPPIAICCGALFSKFILNTKISKTAFTSLTAVFLLIAFSYEGFILYNLFKYNDDPYQASLRQFGQLSAYHNYEVYMVKNSIQEKGIWCQTDIFAAELYGDFKPKNGGFHAFLKDKNSKALIISPENANTSHYITKHSLTVRSKADNFLLISK